MMVHPRYEIKSVKGRETQIDHKIRKEGFPEAMTGKDFKYHIALGD